jgi:hypothetical protein
VEGLYYSARLGVIVVVVRDGAARLDRRALMPYGMVSERMSASAMKDILDAAGYVRIGGK